MYWLQNGLAEELCEKNWQTLIVNLNVLPH
jgi:hypothetical protein